MPFIVRPLQTALGVVYLMIGNRYIDRLFWWALESGPEGIQNLSCNLRGYQARALNFLESKIDNDALQYLTTRIKSILPFSSGKSTGDHELQPSTSFKDRNNAEPVHEPSYSSIPFRKSSTPDSYPRISIITPNYNQGKFLEKCIRSVLAQNYPNLEHIIVDGGSTDNSIEIIKKYENEITFWVSEKDNGQADAINKGLKHATGEIFNWLNSDDYLEQGALFRCAEVFMSNPSAVGWVGGCRRIDPEGNILSIIYPHSFDRENIGQNWYGTQFYQPSCFLSTNRVKEVGGLDPNLRIALDLDLWIRVLEERHFVAGEGIWSNAVIHTEAKTQRLGADISLETAQVQRKYDFLEGANIREKLAAKKGNFRYTQPVFLKKRSRYLKEASRIQTGLFEKPIVVTFISDNVPDFHAQGPDLRLSTILRTLLANECTVNYIHTSFAKCSENYFNAYKGKINFYQVSSDYELFARSVNHSRADYLWIKTPTDVSQLKTTKKLVEDLKEKASSPKIVIDTVPLPNKSFLKKSGSRDAEGGLVVEKQYLKEYRSLFELADTVVLSDIMHKSCIEETLGKKKSFEVIPNVYKIIDWGIPLTKRKNICFFATTDTNHNMDTMSYFLHNIFDSISRQNPRLEFHVIGNNSAPSQEVPKLPNLKIIKTTTDLAELMVNYKLCLFPVVSEQRMSNGLGIAAGAGLPFVTTSIAAEAYAVKDGEECFIADSPEEFSEKCEQCLRDTIAWNNFRIKSQVMIAENFSPKIVATKLTKILS